MLGVARQLLVSRDHQVREFETRVITVRRNVDIECIVELVDDLGPAQPAQENRCQLFEEGRGIVSPHSTLNKDRVTSKCSGNLPKTRRRYQEVPIDRLGEQH